MPSPFHSIQGSASHTAPVILWHGEQEDRNVPGSVGHYVAEAIPNCQATFFEADGHFTLIYNHLKEILELQVRMKTYHSSTLQILIISSGIILIVTTINICIVLHNVIELEMQEILPQYHVSNHIMWK